MKPQRNKPMLHPIQGSICIIMSALSQSVSFTSFRFCSHLHQNLEVAWRPTIHLPDICPYMYLP